MTVNILEIRHLNGQEWVNLIEITIVSVGKNRLEEMEQSHSQKKSELQVLGAVSTRTE